MKRDIRDCTLVLAKDKLLLLAPGMTQSRPLCKLPPVISANGECSWLDEARGLFFIVSNAVGAVVLRVM